MKRPTRRDFLKTAAAGSVAASMPTFLDAQAGSAQGPRPVAPTDRIQLALIGAGGRRRCRRPR